MRSGSPARTYVAALATLAVVVAVAGLGYLAFLAFVKGILVPGEFAAYGLAITAVAAGRSPRPDAAITRTSSTTWTG